MSKISEMWGKMAMADRKARQDARLKIMEKNGVQQSDIDDKSWMILEEGPFGETTIKAYRLIETVEVEIESMVRVKEEK